MDNKCYILYDCSDSTTERGETQEKWTETKTERKPGLADQTRKPYSSNKKETLVYASAYRIP